MEPRWRCASMTSSGCRAPPIAGQEGLKTEGSAGVYSRCAAGNWKSFSGSWQCEIKKLRGWSPDRPLGDGTLPVQYKPSQASESHVASFLFQCSGASSQGSCQTGEGRHAPQALALHLAVRAA